MDNQLLTPFEFKSGLKIMNRVVMAPMTTWSSNEDGTVAEDELVYYRSRVKGVGMVITGCTRVAANGQGFTDEFAAFDDRFIPSLQKLADAAKSGGAPAILQIYHAGNKALPELTPDGVIVSASAVKTDATPFVHDSVIPKALQEDEIHDMVRAFGETTRRAIAAGFDGVEIHGAHGFLIQNFFSPFFNEREDEWGGSLENRMRFPLAVVKEVKRVIGEYAKKPFLTGYRLSPEEPQEGGLRMDDTLVLTDRLIELEVDYIHASLFSVLTSHPIDATDEKTIAEKIIEKVDGRVPVLAAGQLRKPSEAVQALKAGLTLAVVGQGFVMNPDWMDLAASGRESEIRTTLRMSKLQDIHIPAKLGKAIDAAKGWFLVEA